MTKRLQRTLRKEVAFSGVGLHTGKEVTIRFCPAPAHAGIFFRRIDLPGHPVIPAAIEYVTETSRSTTIGVGSCFVQTVEHVLAAIHAFEIDNLCIEVSAGEPPIGDGSSKPFVEMIESVGVKEEESATISIVTLEAPVYYSNEETHLIALPCSEYKISYTLHYPQTSVIRSQFFSCVVNPDFFKNELSSCRTFALYKEIAYLMKEGLIRGGSLENAVVIKDDVIFSKEGLRFPDEMVRHKVLDLIGDLSLVGFPFKAHVIAIRSGHASNIALGKLLMNQISSPIEEGQVK